MRRAAVVLTLLVLAAPARAEVDAHRAEAAERFDRAMTLLEEGDDAGALAELRRVYEIAPHPRVLYNLGLVYAALNRPVEAAAAFDRLLAAPGALPADSLRRARLTRDEQVRRVGLLDVTTNVPAVIEVDGVELGKTPFAAPAPVAAGTHVVAAVSPGYLPVRRELAVAGQTTETLRLELAPSDLRLAHLAVRSSLPDADVLVDGQRVGRTPLPGSLAVAPGHRVVEVRRSGYTPARREVTLDDGASGELAFDLSEDAAAATRPGQLALAVSEPDPDVTVDGRPRGAYRSPLSLPPGLHQVRVERAGFLAAERTVAVPEGSSAVARVTLVPTPDTRAAYKERTGRQRRWGWIGTVGGAALAVGAGALVALNRGPLADARTNLDTIQSQPPCAAPRTQVAECETALSPADDRYNEHKTIQNLGLVALGVGVVAAGVGAALLLTGDDPARYDRAPRDLEARGGVTLAGWAEPGRGGLALTGAF